MVLLSAELMVGKKDRLRAGHLAPLMVDLMAAS